MAYLTLTTAEDKQNNCFKFIGTGSTKDSVSLITGETVGTVSLLNTSSNSDSMMDSCSFYSGPSDSTIVAFGEGGWESCGSVASSDAGVSGAFSYSGGGVSTSASVSSSGSSFSGGCSYSC